MDSEEKTINMVNENYKRMQESLNEEYNNGLKNLDEREYGDGALSYGIYEKQPLKREEKNLKTEVRRILVKRAMLLVMTFGLGAAGIAYANQQMTHSDNVKTPTEIEQIQDNFYNSVSENPQEGNFDVSQIDEQKVNEYESEEHGTTYQDFIDYAQATGAPIDQDSYEAFKENAKRGAR